jgi:hypothetical protein
VLLWQHSIGVTGSVLKGQASFTGTFRAVSFVLAPEEITWLHLIPIIGPMFNIAGTSMVLIASWIALQETLNPSRWRVLLFPILSLLRHTGHKGHEPCDWRCDSNDRNDLSSVRTRGWLADGLSIPDTVELDQSYKVDILNTRRF